MTTLEADLLHRGTQLAYRGPGTAFDGLDKRIRWHASALAVDIIPHWRRQVPVAGRGLRLVPSFFTPWPQLPIDIDDPPVLEYPARGTAAWWHQPRPAPPEVARAVLYPAHRNRRAAGRSGHVVSQGAISHVVTAPVMRVPLRGIAYGM